MWAGSGLYVHLLAHSSWSYRSTLARLSETKYLTRRIKDQKHSKLHHVWLINERRMRTPHEWMSATHQWWMNATHEWWMIATYEPWMHTCMNDETEDLIQTRRGEGERPDNLRARTTMLWSTRNIWFITFLIVFWHQPSRRAVKAFYHQEGLQWLAFSFQAKKYALFWPKHEATSF